MVLAICSGVVIDVGAQQPTLSPRKIALKIVTVWNTGDVSPENDVLAPMVTSHFRAQNIVMNRDQAYTIVKNWRTAFPDFHIEKVITEGNEVVLRIPFTGAHRGTFMGAEPT